MKTNRRPTCRSTEQNRRRQSYTKNKECQVLSTPRSGTQRGGEGEVTNKWDWGGLYGDGKGGESVRSACTIADHMLYHIPNRHTPLPDSHRRSAESIFASALICPFCTLRGVPSCEPLLSRSRSRANVSSSVVLVDASIR